MVSNCTDDDATMELQSNLRHCGSATCGRKITSRVREWVCLGGHRRRF